jgi:hypothetical protein
MALDLRDHPESQTGSAGTRLPVPRQPRGLWRLIPKRKEETASHCCAREINELFDPEKLDISISDNVLPDKETIRLASPSYRGTLDNFGFTNVNVQEDYVIYPDRSRHEIELLDD